LALTAEQTVSFQMSRVVRAIRATSRNEQSGAAREGQKVLSADSNTIGLGGGGGGTDRLRGVKKTKFQIVLYSLIHLKGS
jgi:hypothetical protein